MLFTRIFDASFLLKLGVIIDRIQLQQDFCVVFRVTMLLDYNKRFSSYPKTLFKSGRSLRI